MGQKIIWMQLLLIGILSSFQSCDNGETDKVSYEEYYFINNSDYDIGIKAISKIDNEIHSSSYSIAVDSTFIQEIEIMFGSVTGIIAYSDSVVLEFGNVKEINFLPNSESAYNILNKNNYTTTNKENNRVKYSYTFTNEDFENATVID